MQLGDDVAAVVTGGASGLGRATVLALRKAGTRVAVFDLNAEAGKAFADECGATFVQADVSSTASIDEAFATARAAQGQERILVNCAGIGKSAKVVSRDRETGEIRRYPVDMFQKILDVNTVGSFRCLSAAAAGMLTIEPAASGERGVIINTGSVAASDGQVGQAAYSASKGALVGMTLPIARDLSSEGIRVNTILPGIFDTPIMSGVSDKVRAGLEGSIPFPPRFGDPAEYASLVMEIIRNTYINAECFRLDGGVRMGFR